MAARITSSSSRPAGKGQRIYAAVAATVPLVLGGIAQAGPAIAQDNRILIDFDQDSSGFFQSLTSVDHPGVTFCDTYGGRVAMYGGEESQMVAVVIPDDALGIVFAEPVDSLQMTVGNDQAGFITDQGEVVLTLFSGNEKVGQERVRVNADDIGNEIVSTSGGHSFNRATVRFLDATEPQVEELSVVVDNVYVGQPVVGAANPATSCVGPVDVADPDTSECTINGTRNADVLVGTRRDDVICGFGGDDVVIGRGGDDVLLGQEGHDVLAGRSGSDTLVGGRGRDTGDGGDGRDFARGVERLISAQLME